VKFITDTNLGKLAKWLRILGYDTISYRGEADLNFLRKADREGRVALTRKKDMAARQFSGKLVTVGSDHVQEQLREVMEKLSISADVSRLKRMSSVWFRPSCMILIAHFVDVPVAKVSSGPAHT
jgi:uncharacterized protein with PIN domain